MQRLAGGRSLLDAALSLHQDRIRSSTDDAFAEALQQFHSNLGGIEEILRVTTDSVTSRGMSDFEMRLEDLKQKTVEDLNKSAEWYEKRAQNQTQAAADKAGEQAAKQLREQAGTRCERVCRRTRSVEPQLRRLRADANGRRGLGSIRACTFALLRSRRNDHGRIHR